MTKTESNVSPPENPVAWVIGFDNLPAPFKAGDGLKHQGHEYFCPKPTPKTN